MKCCGEVVVRDLAHKNQYQLRSIIGGCTSKNNHVQNYVLMLLPCIMLILRWQRQKGRILSQIPIDISWDTVSGTYIYIYTYIVIYILYADIKIQ